MKRNKTFLTAVVCLLTLALCFAVTACNKKATLSSLETASGFSLADYATDYESPSVNAKAITGATERKIDGEVLNANFGYGNFQNGELLIVAKQVEQQTRYSVYNMSTGKTIVSNVKNRPTIDEKGSYSNYINVTRVRSDDANKADQYRYVAPDGTELLPMAAYSNVYFSTTGTMLTVTASKSTDNGYEPVEKSFKLEGKAGDITCTATTAASTDNNVNVGDMHVSLEAVYDTSDDQPVTGEIAKYGYEQIGSQGVGTLTVRFYKDGQKTDEVAVKNGSINGFVGNYMYYTSLTPVSPTATEGYNYLYGDDGLELKYAAAQYRYDIINKTTSALGYDTMISMIRPLYNAKTKAYDAGIVVGVQAIDGIFTNIPAQMKAYIADADLKVAFDVTDYADYFLRGSVRIQKLNATRFLLATNSESLIVDENCRYVSSVGNNETVYAEQALIRFQGAYGVYGFKDYEGKVVVAPKYRADSGSIVFYGDYAPVVKVDGQSMQAVLLKKDGTETAVPAEGDKRDGGTVTDMSGGYGFYTYWVEKESADAVTYDFYIKSFDGTTIKSLTGVDSAYGSGVTQVGGNYYAMLTDKDNKTTYWKLTRG